MNQECSTASRSRPSAVSRGDLAVVVGAGVSGLAAARLLAALGARVRLLERKAGNVPATFAHEAAALGIEIVCGEHHVEHFAGARLVVPSPGVAAASIRPFLAAVDPPEIMGETELAWRELTGERILAVTGTSGKTTTTSLCAAMLGAQGFSVFTGGNIGTPLSTYVLERRAGAPQADIVVLELSSFQLQTCSTFHPHVAVLMNISANHLDYHADMEEYTNAKMRLFARQGPEDVAVLHRGMDELKARYGLKARVVWYDTPTSREDVARFAGIRLLGPHNLANAQAAWLACREFGVTEQAATRATASFDPLEHRLERVGERNGVLFVNDSKCTTVEALRVALNAFDGSILLLAGGKFKGGDLAALRPLLKEKARHLALYGASREQFEQAFSGIVPLSWDETLEQAMFRLAALARPGDVVLLAPATSSFDQYENYRRRGADFKRIFSLLASPCAGDGI